MSSTNDPAPRQPPRYSPNTAIDLGAAGSPGQAMVSMVATKTAAKTHSVPAEGVLRTIASDKWRPEIEPIRAMFRDGRLVEAKALKDHLHAVLWAGVFSERNAQAIQARSGIVCIDLDKVGDRLLEIKQQMKGDPLIWSFFFSPSGNGLKVLFWYDPIRPHEAAFRAAAAYIFKNYGVEADENAKDLARLCYVSWDPELWINPNPFQLPCPVELEPAAASTPAAQQPAGGFVGAPHGGYPPLTAVEVQELLASIPPNPPYYDWYHIIAAVKATGLPMAEGMRLLKEWSPPKKLDEYEEQWNQELDEIGVGSLFHYAKENGWKPSKEWRAARARLDSRAIPDRGQAEYSDNSHCALTGGVIAPIPPEDSAKPQLVLDVSASPVANQPPPSRTNEAPPATVASIDPEGWPFRILGFNRGTCYYLPGTRQVFEMTPNAHTPQNLLYLAPLEWWSQNFPMKAGPDWRGAVGTMIHLCQAKGLYTGDIIRGRGCWLDRSRRGEERVVFHAGDRLLSEGTEYLLDDVAVGRPSLATDFVYEQAPALEVDHVPPASDMDAARLLKLCESLPWASPVFGTLLAGWCMVASICGALQWRPHIWVTGAAGLGKSWILANIVGTVLGEFAVRFQGSTTEAGIRQTIRSDARPVVIDEAESEDERARGRFRAVLDLARQASTEGSGSIVKGTVTGTAMEFKTRSCFCFASIGVAATGRADTSRITVLTLERRPDPPRDFEALKDLLAETMNLPDFGGSIRSRAVALVLQIRANAAVFAKALALKLGDQRTGDQLGALAAGAYALTSSGYVAAAAATEWVNAQDWTGFTPEEVDRDENQALAHLLDAKIRVAAGGHLIEEVPIGTLIARYYRLIDAPDERGRYAKALLYHGIKVADDYVLVSNTHQELARIFRETPWAGKWKDQLSRVPGAFARKGSVRFGPAVHRAVQLPKCAFEGEDEA